MARRRWAPAARAEARRSWDEGEESSRRRADLSEKEEAKVVEEDDLLSSDGADGGRCL
jgi:hypothetical protein